METVAVPPDLAAALRAAGLGVRGPAGLGSGGPVWTAVALGADGGAGERFVVHALAVPGGAAGEPVLHRLEALGRLDHPHLARVADVLPVGAAGPDARTLAVLVEEVPGTTLAALLAARAALAPGEVVSLTVPLAGALDTLHAAGLVHGDVSPGNVVVRPDGHPVLIDVLGALDDRAPAGRPGAAGWDGAAGRAGAAGGPGAAGRVRGTPGFVAPEVVAGRRPSRPPVVGGPGSSAAAGGRTGVHVPAGAPADVYALATVALTALDPAAVDGPLGQELAAARADDPVLRPTAGELAAGCFARAVPTPIALPDAGVLARTALAQLAGEGGTVSVDRRSRHRADRPRRADRRHRSGGARRSASRRALGAVGLVAAAVVAGAPTVPEPWSRGIAAATPAGVAATTPAGVVAATPAGVAPAGPAVRAPARPDAVRAAVDLTRRRLEVLVAGDPAALSTVVVAGSSAAAADRALLADLAASGVRLEELTATDVSARVDAVRPNPAGGARPQWADVAVTSGLSAHRRVTPDGAVDVPAQPARTVVLSLVWTAAGWRVDAVRDP
ncbi:hypothetical protein [Cellulomonas aerilata]|uniref:hypothetical protein n=1 Tax=Cellulomonas aerilata TaxID=515326 RepID=UPI0031DC2A30